MNSNELKQLHYDVMDGKTDYIPLAVYTAPEKPSGITPYESMQSPVAHVEAFLQDRANDIIFPTDRAIVIESNYLEVLIPSMLGAQIHISPGGLVAVKPNFEELPDADSLSIGKGLLDEAAEHLLRLKELCPENVVLSITRFMSPLDCAVVTRGGDFYMDLLLEPEKSAAFLNKIADVTLQTLKYFKELLGEDYREHVSNARGLYIRGTRLTGDAIVNLSPTTIEEAIIPIFKKIHDDIGGLMLHYCCLPAPSGHVLPTLAKFPGVVDAVDNWQGVDTFFNEKQEGIEQENVAMCFDVPYNQAFDIEKLMEKPIFTKARRKGGRGIFIGVGAANLEDAKRIYDKWQSYFGKKTLL